MIVIKFDVRGETEAKGISRKYIEMLKYDNKCGILEVKLESGAYEIFNGVKSIEFVEV